MLPLADRHFIDPSCPSGGQFYACSSDSLFLGCCEQQPCPNVCSAGALQPASFNSSFWNNFQDQTCPLNSKWFTCASTHPPFMGCCKINPCENGGCPPSELAASYLSTSPDVAADFLSSSGAVSSATATSPRIATSAVASAASAATISKPGAVSKGTIIGSSIGGAAGLVLVLALVAFLVRQRTKMSQARMAASQPSPTQMANPDMMPFQDPNSEHMTDKSKHGPFSGKRTTRYPRESGTSNTLALTSIPWI